MGYPLTKTSLEVLRDNPEAVFILLDGISSDIEWNNNKYVTWEPVQDYSRILHGMKKWQQLVTTLASTLK